MYIVAIFVSVPIGHCRPGDRTRPDYQLKFDEVQIRISKSVEYR